MSQGTKLPLVPLEKRMFWRWKKQNVLKGLPAHFPLCQEALQRPAADARTPIPCPKSCYSKCFNKQWSK